jgi:transposase
MFLLVTFESLLHKEECPKLRFRWTFIYLKVLTISSILQKWRQNETIERRQGSGRPSTSTAEEDNMLLNRLRNSPFMTAVEAVNTSKYNGKERSIFGKHMGMDFSR